MNAAPWTVDVPCDHPRDRAGILKPLFAHRGVDGVIPGSVHIVGEILLLVPAELADRPENVGIGTVDIRLLEIKE